MTTPAKLKSTTNEFRLYMGWQLNAASAACPNPQLQAASATVSDELLDWLCAGTAPELNPARIEFLVDSFVDAMRCSGWDPHAPHHSSHPLRLGLVSQGTFTEVVARVQPSGEHLLRFEIVDGSCN